MTNVYSFVEARTIARVKESQDALLDRHFSRDERGVFKSSPAQTIAGQLALKAAVRALIEALEHTGEIKIENIEIMRTAAGAPVLKSILGLDEARCTSLRKKLCLSISHSKHQAVGLAVVAKDDPSE